MRVLITDKLAEEAIEKLSEKHEVKFKELNHKELLEQIPEYDALIVRSRTKVTRDVLERGEKLKVIGRAGVGVDNIDVEAATEMGIKVVNAPTSATQSVAEFTIGLMIALSRKITTADRSMHEGKWLKKDLEGNELFGKTLGLIGSGRIGSRVAEIATAIGMNALGYDKKPIEFSCISFVPLDELLSKSDYISIHLPLSPETRHVISKKEFEKMKDGVCMINCSRGGVVDEDALYSAIESGKVAGASIDVYEKEPPEGSPLLMRDELILTPHIGGSTKEGQIRAGITVVNQVIKVLSGEKPEYLIN
jgi:D-3-phosphoglycerate dehydrogenase